MFCANTRQKGLGILSDPGARANFLLMYQQKIEEKMKNKISFLFANLLTEKSKRNKYEFYERAVSRLLGNVTYEQARRHAVFLPGLSCAIDIGL